MSTSSTEALEEVDRQSKSRKFKDWYERHKLEYNRKRQERYRDDEKFRSQVQIAARDRRVEERKIDLKEQQLEAAEKLTHPRLKWRTFEMDVDGTPQTLVSIGACAELLQCSTQGLRLWETQGVIPDIAIRGPGGQRLYRLDQVELLKDLLTKTGKITMQRVLRVPKIRMATLELSDGSRVSLQLFSVGLFAKFLGKTPAYISDMEQREYIPQTPFKVSSRQRRHYTLPQMEAVRDALAVFARDPRPKREIWAEVSRDVRAAWEALHMLEGSVIDLQD